MWFIIRLLLFPLKLAAKVLAPITLVLVALLVGYLFFWLPDVSILADERPETTAFMELTRQRFQQEGKNRRISQTWVDLDRISPALVEAVLIAEDDRFYLHRGFDFTELMNAAELNLKTDRVVRGGSTISQQLAKNLYLSPEKTYTRKLNEALLTWKLEHSLTKDRILEIYLNVAEWGDGIFGVEEAARRLFNTSASGLNESQSVTLAAMLPNPHANRDRISPTRLEKERKILARLKNSPPGYRGVRRALLVEKQKEKGGSENGSFDWETYRRMGELALAQKDQWWGSLFGDAPFEWEKPLKTSAPPRTARQVQLPSEAPPRMESAPVQRGAVRQEPPPLASSPPVTATEEARTVSSPPPVEAPADRQAQIVQRLEQIASPPRAAEPPSVQGPPKAPVKSDLQERLARLEKALAPKE